ncbi:hypothetical protein AgCh_039392 [Apium graveolens]
MLIFVNPVLFADQGFRYQKLDVILTTSVDKLGKTREAVKVAPGHFRNHLMPKLLAFPNIDKLFISLASSARILGQKPGAAAQSSGAAALTFWNFSDKSSFGHILSSARQN